MAASIPKIIHQTWRTVNVPAQWTPLVASWQRQHPDWAYRLWTDADNRDFIASRFPDFLPIYDAYPFNILRADAIRYFLLYEFGGLYVDMDFECLRPLDELLPADSFVAAWEPEEHAGDGSPRLSNALMAATPGHPFLAAVIARLKEFRPRTMYYGDVLVETGPIMLAGVASSYEGAALNLLGPDTVYPLADGPALAQLREQDEAAAAVRAEVMAGGAYAIHYWAHTWVRDLWGELVNPEPEAIAGYDFYPGLDSWGHDLGNFGRDIRRCARLCDADRRAVGFNTDGHLKYYIQPRSRWATVEGAGANEGLYVKRDRLRSWRANLHYRYAAPLLALAHRSLGRVRGKRLR